MIKDNTKNDGKTLKKGVGLLTFFICLLNAPKLHNQDIYVELINKLH